jgi:AraC-like DNA-binding protein
MILQIYKPAFPLDGFVESLVYFDGLMPAHNLDRFLPDGNTEIMIDLTENPQFIHDNQTLRRIQTCRHAWVSGIRTQPITIPSGRGSRMMVVAFKKGRGFPFYPFPLRELTDRVVPADLIFGRWICDLREQLLAAKSVDHMFALMERFLLRESGGALQESTSSRCVQYALDRIVQEPSLRCLRQLSEQIGYSQKHFIDLFRQQVGVSPKQFLKVMRFQKAVQAIEGHEVVQWSKIALASGYYDQAHFINDFKYFSGFTPQEYLRKKTSVLNYIPVD